MAANLMNVFKNTDLKNVGKSMSDVVSLAFKPNKKTGAKIARFQKPFINYRRLHQ